jgi:hypothetical protein
LHRRRGQRRFMRRRWRGADNPGQAVFLRFIRAREPRLAGARDRTPFSYRPTRPACQLRGCHSFSSERVFLYGTSRLDDQSVKSPDASLQPPHQRLAVQLQHRSRRPESDFTNLQLH